MQSIRAALIETYRLTRHVRNWPEVLANIAWSYVRRGPLDLVAVTSLGTSVRCPNSPVGRYALLEILLHDPHRLSLLPTACCTKSPLIIDIGANIGLFTLLACELMPSAQVICYEPAPAALGYLHANIRENRLEDRVKIEPLAVLDRTGSVQFFDLGGTSGRSSIYSSLASNASSAFTVEAVAWDDVTSSLGRPVELVKLDCEGAEYDIVLGSRQESWLGVHQVILEYHKVNEHSFADMACRLGLLGLQLCRHEPAEDGFGIAWFTRPDHPRLS